MSITMDNFILGSEQVHYHSLYANSGSRKSPFQPLRFLSLRTQDLCLHTRNTIFFCLKVSIGILWTVLRVDQELVMTFFIVDLILSGMGMPITSHSENYGQDWVLTKHILWVIISFWTSQAMSFRLDSC